MLDGARDLALQGFKGCTGGFLATQQNPCGIRAAISIDGTGELIWEAAIPLKSFLDETVLKNGRAKPLSICFEINAMKRPAGTQNSGGDTRRSGGMGMGGGRRGGMGGMRGGGRGRGMNSGGDRPALFSSSTSWEKANLAKPRSD